jgi:hypothetical protein
MQVVSISYHTKDGACHLIKCTGMGYWGQVAFRLPESGTAGGVEVPRALGRRTTGGFARYDKGLIRPPASLESPSVVVILRLPWTTLNTDCKAALSWIQGGCSGWRLGLDARETVWKWGYQRCQPTDM